MQSRNKNGEWTERKVETDMCFFGTHIILVLRAGQYEISLKKCILPWNNKSSLFALDG